MTPSLIIIVAAVAILLILLIMFFTYNNKEIYLRKEADAQRKKIESTHDKMWKVIKQKAEVSDKYRETFERVYPEIIAGRYSDGSSAMKWIQEANPNFDTSLYNDLMQAIEIQRTHLHNAQTRMLDVIRERASLIESYPSRWFITNKSEIEYEVISSTKTHNVVETRVDDDVNVFK
mgnify:CR=1 FL=1